LTDLDAFARNDGWAMFDTLRAEGFAVEVAHEAFRPGSPGRGRSGIDTGGSRTLLGRRQGHMAGVVPEGELEDQHQGQDEQRKDDDDLDGRGPILRLVPWPPGALRHRETTPR
jgi:hypothetical protein